MKNRYIPFGYQIQNGDSVINTEQAATVQHIFYAYTEGQSFKEIAEYLTTSGTAYHFSDNSWNKNIVARILANEIYCGAKGYPAIISKEVYSQAASIRSNKTVTYSAVLKPFRSDMQCACCGERLYWRPRTQQWTCRQCGMWSKPMQPENMAQQIVDRLYQIQQHPEIIHNPKEQCNTRSIEVAQLDHEIHTALALAALPVFRWHTAIRHLRGCEPQGVALDWKNTDIFLSSLQHSTICMMVICWRENISAIRIVCLSTPISLRII